MKTILVTGATGAIGSVLSGYLVAEQTTRVRLLIRARSASHLEERLQGLYHFWEMNPAPASVSSRVEAIAGDVTVPGLGMPPPVYRRLAEEVTHVVHSAGNVRLNRPVEEARQSAVDSAQHIVSFVDACREQGRSCKLEFVSTVGVAGRMPGIVPERALREERTFRNTYEAAKAEAEAFVLDRMAQGLPATIHRPSMVVGDSVTGRIVQFQVFYYLCEFLSGRRTAGIVPDAGDVRLDIVPVDYVARAIQMSLDRDDTAGRIFHLCSGPGEAPLVNDLSRRVRAFFAAHGRQTPARRAVPPALLRALLPVASRLVSGRTRRSLQSLPHFLAYLDGAAQTFANGESRRFFAAAGLDLPRPETYLETVLAYYLSRTEALANGASQGAA